MASLSLSCATTRASTSDPAELALALSPASCACALSLDQRLSIFHGSDAHSVDARLEVDAESVQVALVGMGQTLGTLRWDGAHLETTAPMQWPEVVTARRVLSDLQLVWWPEASVRAALPARWTLVEAPLQRQVVRAGVPVITVRYEGTPPGWRRVVLEHLGRYRLEIESTESEAP